MEDHSKNESVAQLLARMQGELSFNLDDFQDPSDKPMPSAGSKLAGDVAPMSIASAIASTPLPQKKSARMPTEVRALQIAEAPARALSDANNDDGIVDDYMSSLLGRCEKHENKAAALGKPEVKNEAGKSTPAGKDDVQSESQGEPEELVAIQPQLLDYAEYLPQKKAPEAKDSIAAMRELAVHSARKAIQDSVHKQRGMDAKFRMSLGGVTALLALGAFVLSEGAFTMMSLLGLCSAIGSSMFLVNWKKTISQKS